MSTSKEAADAIVARIQPVVDARSRAMMGGRLVYVNEVLVGQINEDRFFVKRNDFAAEFAPDLEQAPPYDGAKPALVVPQERLEDEPWLHDLLTGSATALSPRR
jgi:TfoX/Sxy family transcriptional regulator of competence genes